MKAFLGSSSRCREAIGYVKLIYAENNKSPDSFDPKQDRGFHSTDFVFGDGGGDGSPETSIPTTVPCFANRCRREKIHTQFAVSLYLLVWKNMPDPGKGSKLVDFLHWAIKDGQSFAEPLSYSSLPKSLVTKIDKTIDSIQIPKSN